MGSLHNNCSLRCSPTVLYCVLLFKAKFLLIPLSVFLFLLYYIYLNSLHSQDSYLDYIEVSMSDSKDENLAEELFLKLSDPKFVQQQVQNVIDLDWQLGIPVMQADQDGIYEIKPDGTKIYQKK